MSEVIQEHIAPQSNSLKMLRTMVGLGVLCALLIVVTYEATMTRIEHNKQVALEKAIYEVLPDIQSMKPFYVSEDGVIKDVVEKENLPKIYAGYNHRDKVTGIALEASGQGYADIIRVLYGYNPEEESIIGFHVLESKETPGLGDKIEKDETFLANFRALDVALDPNSKKIKNPIVSVKTGSKQNPWEVDAITGATISSRAIAEILQESTAQWMPVLHNKVSELNKGNTTEEMKNEQSGQK